MFFVIGGPGLKFPLHLIGPVPPVPGIPFHLPEPLHVLIRVHEEGKVQEASQLRGEEGMKALQDEDLLRRERDRGIEGAGPVVIHRLLDPLAPLQVLQIPLDTVDPVGIRGEGSDPEIPSLAPVIAVVVIKREGRDESSPKISRSPR